MPSRLLLSLNLLLLLSCQALQAQLIPADDFFHEGAQSYITNNIAKAREIVDQGLKFYPDDTKLKKLDELLKQKNQQQQQQQDQQQQQSQQDQKQDQNQKQDQKDKQKPEQSKDQKDQQQQQEEKGQKPEEPREPKPDEQGKNGEMSQQEAKKLLDDQKNNELLMPASRKEKPRTPGRPIKDW